MIRQGLESYWLGLRYLWPPRAIARGDGTFTPAERWCVFVCALVMGPVLVWFIDRQ